MLKIAFTILLAVAGIAANAQTPTPDSKNFESIPAFTLTLVPDSTQFSDTQLKKGKPVMIMFFSPDCDHCQHQIKEMLAYKEEMKNIQIVMISALPYQYNKDFYAEYGLANLPNIKMGMEPSGHLRSVYTVRTYPSMYVYDASGKLAKAFIGNIPIPSITDAVK